MFTATIYAFAVANYLYGNLAIGTLCLAIGTALSAMSDKDEE